MPSNDIKSSSHPRIILIETVAMENCVNEKVFYYCENNGGDWDIDLRAPKGGLAQARRRWIAKKLARGMDSALISQTKRLSDPPQRDNETASLK